MAGHSHSPFVQDQQVGRLGVVEAVGHHRPLVGGSGDRRLGIRLVVTADEGRHGGQGEGTTEERRAYHGEETPMTVPGT